MKCYSKNAACALPAFAILLAACTADKIEVPDKELYTREFIKQFGSFNSDAGWNSATRVTANIDPSIMAGGSEIKVYTAWPTSPGCRIVASFPAGTSTFAFDYPDGLEYAYVQVIDANGKALYGAYSTITDGNMTVGTAGRSRAEEPTGGSHYNIYTYDLTNNGALGTFPVDEDYNREFWKGLGMWSKGKDIVETPPSNIDTSIQHQISLSNASYPLEIPWWNNTDLNGFGNILSNRIELTVKYQVTNFSEEQERMFIFRNNDGDLISSGNLNASFFEDGKEYSRTFYVKQDAVDKLKNGARITGVNVIINDISYRNLEYVYDREGGTSKFSDLFKLYGLTTTPGVSDMTGYRDYALKPYNDYDMIGYSAHDLVSLVGSRSGVFHEEVNSKTSECNLQRYKDRLRPDEGLDYELNKDGEVSLDYFFGCASTFNSFGYFYYTDEEAALLDSDPDTFAETLLKKPKFILMYRAFPHSNILISKDGQTWGNLTDLATIGDANIVQSGDDEGKDCSDGWKHCDEFRRLVDDAEAEIEAGTATTDRDKQYPRFRSANYRLVYFSPDQFESDGTLKSNQQGSYIFPKGTHIAFFVINGGQYALQKDGEAGFKIDHTRISFSRPLLNKYLGNVFNAAGHSHSAATKPSMNIANGGGTDPWTPFVTYKWGGDIIMGVEDYYAETRDGVNGSDHDMNDMLFRVKGEFVKDREEMFEDTPKGQNWIIACEDLGGTHDFDFNDVVFGVTHVAGTKKATVTALASGGTLPVYIESIYPQATGSSTSVEREDGKTYYTLTPDGTNQGEFHSWWGPERPHSSIINASGWSGPGKSIDIEVDENFTLSDVSKTRPGAPDKTDTNMGGFRVKVKRNGTEYNTISAPTQDKNEAGFEAPQMFLVPHTWKWPYESQFILDVYPDFNNWGEGVEWWNKPTGPSGTNVINHNWNHSTPSTN